MAVTERLEQIMVEIDKSVLHCGCQVVELVEHRFFGCPLAQQI